MKIKEKWRKIEENSGKKKNIHEKLIKNFKKNS